MNVWFKRNLKSCMRETASGSEPLPKAARRGIVESVLAKAGVISVRGRAMDRMRATSLNHNFRLRQNMSSPRKRGSRLSDSRVRGNDETEDCLRSFIKVKRN